MPANSATFAAIKTIDRDGRPTWVSVCGSDFTYDSYGHLTGGNFTQLSIRTTESGGAESWVIYREILPSFQGNIPNLLNPYSWHNPDEPVVPVLSFPNGVPMTTLGGPTPGLVYTVGTDHADRLGIVLSGLALPNETYGAGGNDTLVGNGLSNSFFGGTGNDLIYGGAGDDKLWGDAGDDRISGGAGNDSVDGGAGNDFINLGAGDDVGNFSVSTGNDTLIGGAGHDQIYGSRNDNRLFGGSESDYLNGVFGNDVFFGGAGDDVLVGGGDLDRVFDDLDVLFGGAGADIFIFDQDQPGHGATVMLVVDFSLAEDRLMVTTGPSATLQEAYDQFMLNAVQTAYGVCWRANPAAEVYLRGINLADLSVGDLMPTETISTYLS